MRNLSLLAILCILMLSFNTANAELGLGVTVKGGSLGIGADITKSITEKINVRAGMI